MRKFNKAIFMGLEELKTNSSMRDRYKLHLRLEEAFEALGSLQALEKKHKMYDTFQGVLDDIIDDISTALGREMPEEEEEYLACLSNLLAVIHKDGGHYQDMHGIQKATQDAIELIAKWREVYELSEQFSDITDIKYHLGFLRYFLKIADTEEEQEILHKMFSRGLHRKYKADIEE